MNQPPARSRKLLVLTILALFLLPVAARAALFAYAHGPMSWRDADWSTTRTLPAAADYRPARLLVMTGQTYEPQGGIWWEKYWRSIMSWDRPL